MNEDITIDNLDIVKRLTADAEGSQMEFKETTGQLERAMKTLCAFLNGAGGTVLFGVTDKGKIIGQEVADPTKRNIAEAVNRLEPLAEVQVSYIAIPDSDRKIIALRVEEARFERPFCYKGRAYMRMESVTAIMPQAIYNELLMQRDGIRHFWESYPNPNLKLSDLDNNEIKKTVRLGIEYGRLPETTGTDIPTILEKIGVLENNVLTYAAAILFANRKLTDYPQCLLRLARFRGTDKTVFIDNQCIHGNLFQLLDAAMTFIFKHLSLSGTTDTLEREEHLTVPYKAIREGVVNSLCHRSWRDASGSVAIAIYDDRVEIENPGSFPIGWDLEKIKSRHGSKPHNPVIADVLYIRKILESWGRGISLIMNECQKANLPEPEYLIDADEVKLIFRFKEFEQIAGQVAGQVDSLINCLANDVLSVKEIMERLSLRGRDNFLNAYLNPALKDGLIIQTHPENPKHPKQKYRLTDKGRELLKG